MSDKFSPPETVVKNERGEMSWTIIWEYGENIELTASEMVEGPESFNRKYREQWGTDPDIDSENWPLLLNQWLPFFREESEKQPD